MDLSTRRTRGHLYHQLFTHITIKKMNYRSSSIGNHILPNTPHLRRWSWSISVRKTNKSSKLNRKESKRDLKITLT
jgi:hypothetical protein